MSGELRFCTDCEHVRHDLANDMYVCVRNYVPVLQEFDLVTGMSKPIKGEHILDCRIERLRGNACGKEGKYWKQKDCEHIKAL